MSQTHQLKHNAEDALIIRQKRQILNLLIVELDLRGAHYGWRFH